MMHNEGDDNDDIGGVADDDEDDGTESMTAMKMKGKSE